MTPIPVCARIRAHSGFDFADVGSTKLIKQPFAREATLFLALIIIGITLLPLAIFFVGDAVFGSYGGGGFGDFFESLLGKLARADLFAWLLVLSPYIVLQIIRFMAKGWRDSGSDAY